MFKKLKEKITEEVKSSPQRFQQLTQSVSERLQNTSTSDENFFSIGEDDVNTSSKSIEPGFTSVSLMSPEENRFRRNSSSSVSSDVSFLPRYEAFGSIYHLQSDLEVSASEIEDNASSSSQLGHLSKEQIYSAFQKSQVRYHKYRGRYTDLAKHYKELERENGKMKSLLVETQDKAIRRVTELKEQCTLEQKAKAHLESALRDELDEKQFKIQSLETKIELLQNGGPIQNTEQLDTLNKYLTDARQEIENLNQRIQELKASLIISQTKEQEHKAKISNLEKDLLAFSEREKENNLTLAQNKMEIHNEIILKDNEISSLKQDNETLRKSLDLVKNGSNKVENLQTQNKKLIDKVESLTTKCNNYESEMLKMQQYKAELHESNQSNAELKNQLKKVENELETVREDAKKRLLSLESKIEEKLQIQFAEKENEMKKEFEKKLESISSNEENLKDIHLDVINKEEEIRKLREVNDGLLEDLSLKISKYDDLERNHLELIDDNVALRGKISHLEKELGLKNNEIANLKILEKKNQDYEATQRKFEATEAEVKSLKEERRNLLEDLEDILTGKKNLELELSEIKEKLQSIKQLEDKNLLLEEELEGLKIKNEEEIQSVIQEKNALLEKLTSNEEKFKELEKLKNVEEEKEAILRQSEAKDSKIQKIEEINDELSSKIGTLQEEIRRVTSDFESEREMALNLKSSTDRLEEDNAELAEKLKQMTVLVEEQSQKLKENETGTDSFHQRISDLKTELSEALKSSNEKTEEILNLKEKLLKNSQLLTEKTESYSLEITKNEEELNRVLDEINLLKGLLEEANNNLKLKQHQLDELKETCLSSGEEIQKLFAEKEGQLQKEQELLVKINKHQEGLNEKNLEIDTLSKKLGEYESSIGGFMKAFSSLFEETPNHVKNNQKFADFEEKLQKLEENLCFQKDLSFGKILTQLKQVEQNYRSTKSERNQFEEEKKDLLLKVENLEEEIKKTKQMEIELKLIQDENSRLLEDKEKISQNLDELKSENTQVMSKSDSLSEEKLQLLEEIKELKMKNEEIKNQYTEKLENDLKQANNDKDRLAELENIVGDLQREKQILQEEIENLKRPHNQVSKIQENEEHYVKEIETLRSEVIQYKSLDLTNRSSIDFYENELQKLKNQNEKLNRKLDETLVTLNHCSELSHSTEIEYLRNVLYNYMLGKESLVLARVIAAVCKFDPQQTEMILTKEQQKQTLLGQLGLL